MSERLSPESAKARELENMLSSAYDKLFEDLGRSTDLEAINLVQQILVLGVIEHSLVGERDYPAESVGFAERSWPNLIKLRSETYKGNLDIVPGRIENLGKNILDNIDPKVVIGLPSQVHSAKVMNKLSGDADDLEFARYAIEQFCPDAMDDKYTQDIPKVA